MTINKGDRIILLNMPNDPNPIPKDTRGTVNLIDDAGQVHVTWDNGRTLAVIPGVDEFALLQDELKKRIQLLKNEIKYEHKKMNCCAYGRSDLLYLEQLKQDLACLKEELEEL